MNMIGVSLATTILLEQPRDPVEERLLSRGGADGFLTRLKEAGVSSIELRSGKTDPESLRAAAEVVSAHGLNMTLHGSLSENCAEKFMAAAEAVLSVQKHLNVTVHPLRNGKEYLTETEPTVRELKRVLAAVHEKGLDITVTLENCRMKSGFNPTCSLPGIIACAKEIADPALRLCWDFGHYWWDQNTYPEQSWLLSEQELACAGLAGHTHIHDLCGATHFPLGTGHMPLRLYVKELLSRAYSGVFNLELEPERWNFPDPEEKYMDSVRILRELLTECAPKPVQNGILTIFGTCSGTEPVPGRHHCSFCIGHADRLYWFDAGENCAYAAHVNGIDVTKIRAIFISHPHMDHIGGLGNLLWTIRKLDGMGRARGGEKLSLFLPKDDLWKYQHGLLQLTEGDFKCSFPIEQTLVTDGFRFSENGLTVEALHNLHLTPCDDGAWRSYSYRITVDGKVIVFTGDVGHLSDIEPLLHGADVIIAETGHHHPARLCHELMEMGCVPGKLLLIHHGRVILDAGEVNVDIARKFFPAPITVLNDMDRFVINDL